MARNVELKAPPKAAHVPCLAEPCGGMVMPKVIYTGADRVRIEAILKELDPQINPLTLPFKAMLDEDDWRFVVDYARAEIRAALEIGLLARGMADAARRRGVANDDGVAAFMDSASWMRNFGVSDGADERFKRLADVESPLFFAVDSLLQLAQDRLFNTLDEEYLRLLDSGR
jgi:hypothetical protein